MSDPGRIAFSLTSAMCRLGTGEMAALRRLDAEAAIPAYWRLAARHDVLDYRREAWVPIVQSLALLTPKGPPEDRVKRVNGEERPGLHDEARSFGEALCDGGDPGWPGPLAPGQSPKPCLSERRLAQLLAARGAQRRTLLVRAVRALAARRDQNVGLDVTSLAWAFLNDDPRPIAGPYYRRLDRAERSADAAKETKTADA